MASLAPYIFPQFFDDNGDPLSGGLIYAYAAGTTTPQDTYSNAAGSSLNTNPIVLSGTGRGKAFLQNLSYDFVIKSSTGVTIDTIAGIGGSGGGTQTAVANLTELRALPSGAYNYVTVGGHATAGDGGGGEFYWDRADGSGDDDGIIIRPSSSPVNGRWVRLYSGSINVKWFGVVGDGATNDYEGIEAANAYVQGLTNGGTLVFPASTGSYLHSSALAFGSNVTVKMDPGGQFSAVQNVTFAKVPDLGVNKVFASTTGVISFPKKTEILPEWWGALANGTSDDLVYIKKVVETIRVAGGGILKFQPASYAVSNRIPLISNIVVKGSGRGLTFIVPTTSVTAFTALNIFIAVRDYTFAPSDVPDIAATYYGPHENIVIQDLTVDGPVDDTRPRGGGAIRIQNIYGLRISRVHVRKASDEAIRVDGYGAGAFVFDASDPFWGNAADAVVEDCYVEDAYVGVEFEGGINGGSVRNCTAENVVRGFRSTSSYKTVFTGNRVLSLKYTTHYGAAIVDPVGMMSQQSRDIIFSENYIDTGDDTQIAFSFSTTERGKFINNIVESGYYSEATGTGFTTSFPDDCEVSGNRFTGIGVTTDGYDNVLFRLRKSKRVRFDQNTFINGKALINDVCTGSGTGNRGSVVNLRTTDFFAMNTTIGDNSAYNSGPLKVVEDVAGDLVALTVDNTNAAGGTAQVITHLWRFLGSSFARDGARLKVSKTSDYSALSSRDASLAFGVAENGVLVDMLHMQQDRVTIRAGLAATPDANLGGVLKSAVTNTQNITTGETNLHSFDIAANTVSAARQSVQLIAEGSFGATANAKTIRVYFGATAIFNTGGLAINTSTWRIMVNITRVDSSTAIYSVKMDCPDALLTQALGFSSGELTGLNWAIANTFKLTGQGGASGDIRQKASKYLWFPDGI